MSRIISGFGTALLALIILPLIVGLSKHGFDWSSLVVLLWITIYASPFIVIGAFVMHTIERYCKIKGILKGILIYGLIGSLISLLPIYLFNFYHDLEISIVFVALGAIGSIGYFFGSKIIKNAKWQKWLSIVVPISYVIIIVIVTNFIP